MDKVILLGASNRWSIINGILILMVSVMNFILSADDGPLFYYLTLGLMISSALLIAVMILSSVKTSKYAVKVTINDQEIRFKTHFFGKPQQLNWQDINSIGFGPYRITFRMTTGETEVNYATLAKISVEIKESIRQMAALKGIEVTGG